MGTQNGPKKKKRRHCPDDFIPLDLVLTSHHHQMSQLFVDEDDRVDDRRGYRPSTTTIKEENDEDESSPSLEYVQAALEENDDDDPIIESIPLVMNQVPSPATQSLHLLQYPGRPKNPCAFKHSRIRINQTRFTLSRFKTTH